MEKELNKKTNISYTEKSSTEEKKQGVPPGATIISKSVNTTTEEIENGFLITKSYDIKYQNKKGDSEYAYYTKKWYSKEDPLEIKLKDTSLAEEFKS